MLLWFSMFSFFLLEEDGYKFLHIVEVREDYLLFGDIDGARTPSLSATGKRVTQWLKE